MPLLLLMWVAQAFDPCELDQASCIRRPAPNPVVEKSTVTRRRRLDKGTGTPDPLPDVPLPSLNDNIMNQEPVNNEGTQAVSECPLNFLTGEPQIPVVGECGDAKPPGSSYSSLPDHDGCSTCATCPDNHLCMPPPPCPPKPPPRPPDLPPRPPDPPDPPPPPSPPPPSPPPPPPSPAPHPPPPMCCPHVAFEYPNGIQIMSKYPSTVPAAR